MILHPPKAKSKWYGRFRTLEEASAQLLPCLSIGFRSVKAVSGCISVTRLNKLTVVVKESLKYVEHYILVILRMTLYTHYVISVFENLHLCLVGPRKNLGSSWQLQYLISVALDNI